LEKDVRKPTGLEDLKNYYTGTEMKATLLELTSVKNTLEDTTIAHKAHVKGLIRTHQQAMDELGKKFERSVEAHAGELRRQSDFLQRALFPESVKDTPEEKERMKKSDHPPASQELKAVEPVIPPALSFQYVLLTVKLRDMPFDGIWPEFKTEEQKQRQLDREA
jgi:hypothetical protein